MADDTDVIARIYPPNDDGLYSFARSTIEKNSLFKPARKTKQPLQRRRTRETTAPLEVSDGPDFSPYLEVRFSLPPRTSSGLVFGTDENLCDVILPDFDGLGASKRHFALTYKTQVPDGYPRLIIRDLGSTHGTMVKYIGLGDEYVRSDFDWIINGFKFLEKNVSRLIVQIHPHLQFLIVVSKLDIKSPTYAENVERFCRGTANTNDLMHALGIQTGPQTQRNTGTHTPSSTPIILRVGELGSGGFGTVTHQWNVSTGEEFAVKEPMDKRKEKYVISKWEHEIKIMNAISHEHIVRLCRSTWMPAPQLYLEYMPFGNLEDAHREAPFSYLECLRILEQCTSALAYLHGLPVAIAHRDLKPANILVYYRAPDGNPDRLHIKLSDFGLAKAGNSLRTEVHSHTYCPPEICQPSASRYTKRVDIWSLGVVILKFAYGLPHPGHGFGLEWCKKIVRSAQSAKSGGLIEIVRSMLCIDAGDRCSAADCFSLASQLIESYRDRSIPPTPAPRTADYGAATASLLPRITESSQDQRSTSRSIYDGCWRDPLHPLGGGSSLAGEVLPDWKPPAGEETADEETAGEESELKSWKWQNATASVQTPPAQQQAAAPGNDLAQGEEIGWEELGDILDWPDANEGETHLTTELLQLMDADGDFTADPDNKPWNPSDYIPEAESSLAAADRAQEEDTVTRREHKSAYVGRSPL